MKKVLVPLAPGFEEIEAMTVIDILRRAGASVVVAGTVDGPITGKSNVRVLPDTTLDNVESSTFDMIVLPGGGLGTDNLKKDERVKKALKEMNAAKKQVTAICAAPTVLAAAGVTAGKTITSYPSVRDQFKTEKVVDDRVVTDGNITTSQSPGSAMEFAFKLVEILYGKAKAKEVNDGVLARL